MKKRLTAMMALTMAGVLLFAIPVSASSTSTTTTSAAQKAKQEAAAPATAMAEGVSVKADAVMVGGKAVSAEVIAKIKLAPVTNATVSAALTHAQAAVSPSASVLKIMDVTIPDELKGQPVTMTFEVPSVSAGQKVMVLHQKADGTWEEISPDAVANGQVTATFTSFSPIAFVVYNTAAKTMDVTPYVMMMALICLAGGALFMRRRYSF